MNKLKKYSFRFKIYSLYTFAALVIVIIGYFLAPQILNFPPYSEDINFQKNVESIPHIYQYITVFIFFSLASIIIISILFKDIFKLMERNKIPKDINTIREKCFLYPEKIMIYQMIATFAMCTFAATMSPEASLIGNGKLFLFYITLVACSSVISSFLLTEWLRNFVIWSYKDETDFSFKFKKSKYENRLLGKILPLVIVLYIVIAFFAYSLATKEIGLRGYEYYKGEISRLDLKYLTLTEVIDKLETVPLWRSGDAYFYSNEGKFIGSNNRKISNFFTEYTKEFMTKMDGHVYDFFGIETEGYATIIKTIDGNQIYIGFIYETTDYNLLILIAIILLVSITISIIYLKSLLINTSRDIKLILKKLTDISAGDSIDYSEKIPISANNELGEIIATYNKIQDLNKDYVYQLNIATKQAERANQAKTDFLASMSHEIRTPLNAIVGFSQALAEENIPGEAKEEVNDIIMASNNLLEIVNGILDISKIEANKLEIVNTEYDAHRLMRDVIALTKARIASKPLDFRINIDPSMPEVLYGDHTRVKQIMINILTNAVKYTKEGYVDLTINTLIKDDICRLIISVEDSGIGIKPEDVDKLFTKFQRFELEKNVTTEGTGLGLAITKSLAELMGGKIVVQSKYGEGSKFTISLDQRIVAKTAETLKSEYDDDTTPFNAAGQRIMVVDDNKVNLKVAKRLLRDYNVEVVLVLSGQDCLNLILSGDKFDLILMDDMMPRMTGTEALKHLRNIIGFNTPIVALTANAISGMRERYLSLGFDDYLAKPIDRDKMHFILRRYLNETGEYVSNNLPLEDTQEININLITDNITVRNTEFLEVNGIDLSKGLELLGDMQTYEMTLEDFYEESKSRLELLNLYKEQNDMQNYAILVHAMKSDAKYLGFTKLAELSFNHEMASKENKTQYIDESYNDLTDEAARIMSVIKKYLGK